MILHGLIGPSAVDLCTIMQRLLTLCRQRVSQRIEIADLETILGSWVRSPRRKRMVPLAGLEPARM